MNRNNALYVTLLAAAATALLTAGCGRKPAAAHFGEPFTDAPVVTPSQLAAEPEAYYHKAVRVRGTVERQCPVAGCWVFLRDAQGVSIRVEMGDYLSKLPQNIGSTAEVEGEWIRKGEGHEFIGTRVEFSGKETH
jgi:hypothetical protein